MKPSFKSISLLIAFTILLQSCDKKNSDSCEIFEVSIEQTGPHILKANESFGAPPFTYSWSTGETLDEIIVNVSGTYSCIITDAAGCTKTASYYYTETGYCGISTVTDVDGNIYNVVSIGTQCWMQQNLRVTSGIPEVSDDLDWGNLNTPGWRYFQNDDLNGFTYGKLYNWAAVNAGNLCPDGWHVPTLDDWNELINYLGGQSLAGGPLKSITGWEPPNTGATNSSGFTALGSGYCGTNGAFWDEGRLAAFWTGTAYEFDTLSAWAVTLSYQYTVAAPGWSPKASGYSCRCEKD